MCTATPHSPDPSAAESALAFVAAALLFLLALPFFFDPDESSFDLPFPDLLLF